MMIRRILELPEGTQCHGCGFLAITDGQRYYCTLFCQYLDRGALSRFFDAMTVPLGKRPHITRYLLCLQLNHLPALDTAAGEVSEIKGVKWSGKEQP